LDDIADALLGADEDSLPRQILARPNRLLEIRAQRQQ